MSSNIDPFSPYSDISIDYSNPIVKGLTDVFLPSRNAWVNLLDNVVYPDTSTGSLTATVFGNSYGYPDDDPAGRAIKPFTEPSLNEFTVVSVVNPSNSTADQGLVTVSEVGTAGWSVLHWADTDSSLLRPALGASSDGGTTNDIAFGTANTIIVGKLNAVVVSRKVSGEFRFAVNGVYSTASASSLVPSVITRETRLASRASTSAMALEGDAFAFFKFNRQLSESESISLSNDPFQIFKPNVDPLTTVLTAATQAPAVGRIMGSLAGTGGLAGAGGLAGRGGGLAG